ncbi:Cys-rich protein [Leptospira idonii]|nr:Cys-rich protein [Leptospira idonii]
MKKTICLVSASLSLFLGLSLNAADFPKCKEACEKYYNCSIQVHPTATEDQKQMLKKGCDFNCNKPKFYNQIAGCLTSSGNTCQSFSACIMKQMGGK